MSWKGKVWIVMLKCGEAQGMYFKDGETVEMCTANSKLGYHICVLIAFWVILFTLLALKFSYCEYKLFLL
jgi:hypothetical protein